MRCLLLISALLVCSNAAAETTVCVSGRCFRQPTVIVQSVSAQQHADQLAATNTFVHCGRRGVGYEGLGFSTASPSAACRSACFWGQRRVREIGTAWCPARRGWIAVVRYE